jgi:N-acetylglucosaminyldiphosphoundecaprenol N-acetyl-beta-D-mannosaminyltransferase
VKWGARLVGGDLPYRYTPPDWFPRLVEVCAAHEHTLYFLGAHPGVAERAADQLRAALPGLQVVGTQHGYFDRSAGSAENAVVVRAINAVRPDLLVIGLGQPAQERWLTENWTDLNARVALPVGAMFDYLTGEVRRAPRWMTDHGLEWLGRLLVEPGRLVQRYLVGIPLFLWRLLKQRTSVRK